MSFRLLPTFRLARQLSRELSYPFWAAPRPSLWWEYPRLPSESDIIREHVGMMERLLKPMEVPTSVSNATYYRYYEAPKHEEKATPSDQDASQQTDTKSDQTDDHEAARTPEEFQVSFDLNEFSPEEIKVKLVGDSVLYVEAEHESQKDGREVKRYFSHYYNLPDNVDVTALKSIITKNGTLQMTAPLMNKQPPPPAERIIPIQQDAAADEQVKEASAEGTQTPESGKSEETLKE